MTSSLDPVWVDTATEPSENGEPFEDVGPLESKGAGDSLVGDTLAGSVWTGVSRATGFIRAAAIAAVLGATYFGNTFQALNSLPNLIYYELLAGSLFASVLVPVLVRHLDDDDPARARQILSGFLGAMLLVSIGAGFLLLIGGWFVVQLMAAGVSDPGIAAAQRHVGALFLVLFVPQIALYVIAGVGAAAMNSRHRFALAAGAPAVENVVILVFLALTVVWFGSETNIETVSDSAVFVLGIGATLAVGTHAALQWWGARRAGMPLIPSRGWTDADVKVVVRRMVPALAFSGMAFVQVLAFLVAANRVAGGVVALQLALNFFYLPLALVAWPIARALLPQLAHVNGAAGNDAERAGRFAADFRRAVELASFLAMPIAIAYLVLSFPLARVVAFGKLQSEGVNLLGWSIAAIGLGVLFETWFILGTYASYAREDMRTPLGPMALRVGVSLLLMVAALTVHGDKFVPVLAAALVLGSLAGALRLSVLVKRSFEPEDDSVPRATGDGHPLRNSLLRSFVAALALAGPAWLVTTRIEALSSAKMVEIAALTAGALVGGLVYVGVHQLFRSPELGWVTSTLSRKRAPVPALHST